MGARFPAGHVADFHSLFLLSWQTDFTARRQMYDNDVKVDGHVRHARCCLDASTMLLGELSDHHVNPDMMMGSFLLDSLMM